MRSIPRAMQRHPIPKAVHDRIAALGREREGLEAVLATIDQRMTDITATVREIADLPELQLLGVDQDGEAHYLCYRLITPESPSEG